MDDKNLLENLSVLIKIKLKINEKFVIYLSNNKDYNLV